MQHGTATCMLSSLCCQPNEVPHLPCAALCCRKKLVEVENKLKVAVADRQTAAAEKAHLEKQLRQQQGQKLLIEKSLEKKDAMENKKRESIMVVRGAASCVSVYLLIPGQQAWAL